MAKRKSFKVLFFLGPPNSGKGTQAAMIAKKRGYYHFSSSGAGKEYMLTHNDSGTLKQRERYDAGILFDPDWMIKVGMLKIGEILTGKKRYNGIVFDGSPRTLKEAKRLYKFWVSLIGKENVKIFHFDVDMDELKERAKKRLVCSSDGRHVYIESGKYTAGTKCPECGGLLKKRRLDREELMDTRMEEFKETLQGIEYLARRHTVITLKKDSQDAVYREILKHW